MTDVICEKCGRNMVIKSGRFGIPCVPGFPECTNTKPITETPALRARFPAQRS
ncbi:MAG: topoisomerase DNA-binding C4 zinc finger domain-containing protein [Butyricicoccaceae bacterium]